MRHQLGLYFRPVFVLLLLVFAGLNALPAAAQAVPASRAELAYSYAPVVKRVAPAVVNIYTQKIVTQRVFAPLMDDPFFRRFFEGMAPQGLSRQRMENSLGSGVIVSGKGLVVTNNHVIAGADEITVVLNDRREFPAKVISSDERTDLAVISIEAKGETLPFLELRDSDDIEVGDLVLAIGNPFGVGQTVTNGIVSALSRTGVAINDLNYFIQTDAAINPGNSGGALVTMDGRLIGINSAIYSRSGGSMGIGFAVPSNLVQTVLTSVSTGQKNIVRPWTGIEGQEVTPDLAASLSLARPSGVVVSDLHPASPARAAGLRRSDVITAVNGRSVDDPAALRYRIATLPVGSSAELDIVRAGQKQKITLPLIAPPEAPPRSETLIKGRNPLAGASLININPAVQDEYNIHDADRGVLVVKVTPNSAADGLGLRPGDFILRINGAELADVSAAEALLQTQARTWRITLGRGGNVVNLIVGG
jgi:serine protease Do